MKSLLTKIFYEDSIVTPAIKLEPEFDYTYSVKYGPKDYSINIGPMGPQGNTIIHGANGPNGPLVSQGNTIIHGANGPNGPLVSNQRGATYSQGMGLSNGTTLVIPNHVSYFKHNGKQESLEKFEKTETGIILCFLQSKIVIVLNHVIHDFKVIDKHTQVLIEVPQIAYNDLADLEKYIYFSFFKLENMHSYNFPVKTIKTIIRILKSKDCKVWSLMES